MCLRRDLFPAVALGLLLGCGASPLTVAVQSGDLATSCQLAGEYGTPREERSTFTAAVIASLDGDVRLARVPEAEREGTTGVADLWRFEVEIRSLPEGAAFEAGLPTWALRGEYSMSVVPADEDTVTALVGPPPELQGVNARLDESCQEASRPHTGSIYVRGFPLVSRLTRSQLGAGHYREPTPIEREAQRLAVAQWEAADAERRARCAHEISGAERALAEDQSETRASRRRGHAAVIEMLTATPGCPDLRGDLPAGGWPMGVRCVYHLRAEHEQAHIPSALKFRWEMRLSFDGCYVRKTLYEGSRARTLESGAAEVFSEGPLFINQPGWH